MLGMGARTGLAYRGASRRNRMLFPPTPNQPIHPAVVPMHVSEKADCVDHTSGYQNTGQAKHLTLFRWSRRHK